MACLYGFVILSLMGVAFGDWIKPLDPPDPVPDVDKTEPNRTCWLATAANMLGAAGYSDEPTAQLRARYIYNQLVDQYGVGW
jgi:hypothetical protein